MRRMIDNKKVRYNANGDEVEINAGLKVDSKIVDSSGNEIKAVVANPTEDTTGTLSKIKIGDTAYAVGGGDNTLLIFASSNVGQTGDYEFYADTDISDDSVAKLINGDIKVISGTFAYKNGNIGYFSTSYCGNKSEYGENYNIYEGVNVNSSTNKLEKFSIKYNTTSHPNSISLRYVQYALTRG